MSVVRERLATASISLGPVSQVLRVLKHRIYMRRRRQAAQEGLAVNDDHRAVRDLALDLLGTDEGTQIVLMEDLPYLWSRPAEDAVAEVEARHRMRALAGSMAVDRNWKHERIAAYASQLRVMDPGHDRLSSITGLPARERHWRLTRQ